MPAFWGQTQPGLGNHSPLLDRRELLLTLPCWKDRWSAGFVDWGLRFFSLPGKTCEGSVNTSFRLSDALNVTPRSPGTLAAETPGSAIPYVDRGTYRRLAKEWGDSVRFVVEIKSQQVICHES